MSLPDYLPGRFALSRGRPSDYFALEHLHYLPQRPATYADVWVVRYHDPAVAPPQLALPLAAGFSRGRAPLRFAQTPPPFGSEPQGRRQAAALNEHVLCFSHQDPLESRWRAEARLLDRDDDDEDTSARLVAVGVLSFPSFRSAPRERVLRLRHLSHRDRVRFCNAHVRTVSRVVVHPQFRGVGLASELVRALIAACPMRYVEAAAVMAHVHPFFASAGMRRVDDERSDCDETDSVPRPAYFIFDKLEGESCA